MKNKKGAVNLFGILGILAIVGILAIAVIPGASQSIFGTRDDRQETNDQITGKAATLTWAAYTGDWGKAGAKTLVGPTVTVTDNSGSTLVSDAQANTTNTAVGEVLSVYETGATYYATPILSHKVKNEVDRTSDIKSYAAAATTDLVITAYDENEDALTADDNSNNTADYAGGDVAAADNQVYYVKLQQTGANLAFNLGAICTWMVGDEADDIELVQSGWTEVNVPDALASASITMTQDDGGVSGNNTEKGFKHCYTPDTQSLIGGKGLLLLENEDTGKLKFVFDSDDSTQPTANGETWFGISFADASWSVDKLGTPVYGFYMDDDTEDPASVGVDESLDTTWTGLDVAVAIEPPKLPKALLIVPV